MQDRVTIIESFKSFLGERKRSIGNRLANVGLLKYFSASIILLATLVTLKSLFSFDFLPEKMEWNNSALLIIFSITYSIQGPRYFYESKLLKHLKKLKQAKIDSSAADLLNDQLKTTIKNLNDTKKQWFIFGLVIILLIASMGQMIIDDFEYWNYFKIPFLLFIILVLFDFFKSYSELSGNIKEYEKLYTALSTKVHGN